MKLSARGKYGLYAMMYLAKAYGDGPRSLREIAGKGMPDPYLEQLLGGLRRAGLVTSVRGAQGGYQLSKAPEEITVREIVEAMEGPLTLSQCMGEKDCPKKENCPDHEAWQFLTDQINGLLDGITLTDMFRHQLKGNAES